MMLPLFYNRFNIKHIVDFTVGIGSVGKRAVYHAGKIAAQFSGGDRHRGSTGT